MTALDILVLLLVGLGIAAGVSRGFVLEVMSAVAWLAALGAVKVGYAPLRDWLEPQFAMPAAAVLAVVLLFGLTLGIGRLVARRLGKLVRVPVLGPVDRLLGGGFGAVKGLIGAALLFLLASIVFIRGDDYAQGPGWLVDARSYPLLRATSRALVDFVSEQARER